jgi:hypothetical protein
MPSDLRTGGWVLGDNLLLEEHQGNILTADKSNSIPIANGEDEAVV